MCAVSTSFDTDNGIRRATTSKVIEERRGEDYVSIPITVLGGLQHDLIFRSVQILEVSIPITVLGGLQRELLKVKQVFGPEWFRYR